MTHINSSWPLIRILTKGSHPNDRSSDINHELAKASLPGFEHLNEDLHVLVEYEGPPEHREKCLGIASRLVAPLLVNLRCIYTQAWMCDFVCSVATCAYPCIHSHLRSCMWRTLKQHPVQRVSLLHAVR